MSARPITERMADAKAKMIADRSVPRAFYLDEDDYREFVATSPETVTALFRSKPRQELGFDGVAVRQATGIPQRGKSRLFCCYGTTVQVPAA